jgi:hypothetical protein
MSHMVCKLFSPPPSSLKDSQIHIKIGKKYWRRMARPFLYILLMKIKLSGITSRSDPNTHM